MWHSDDEPAPLWQMNQMLFELPVDAPLVASWEASTHPAQIRLKLHLSDLGHQLGDLDRFGDGLGLEYLIDVQKPERLLKHYDLENYLTPLVNSLGSSRFRYVRASKHVGGGSTLRIFSTSPSASSPTADWQHYRCKLNGSAQSKQWKRELEMSIASAGAEILPPGQVAVEIVWTASPDRNWVSLWKPTGDALSPVLGRVRPNVEFNPQDDRITSLGFHVHRTPNIGHDVRVDLWFRHLQSSS